MIAYDKEIFENTLLLDEAERLRGADFINNKQSDFIESNLNTYNQQKNIFARIGLFLLACLLMAAVCGFFALIFLNAHSDGDSFGVLLFINALFSFIGLELIAIRNLKYYGNGFDDALLLSGQLNLIGFVAYLNNSAEHLVPVYFASVIICSFCALRYVDRLSVILACLGLIGICVNFFASSLWFPFVLIVLTGGIYYLYLKLSTNKTSSALYSGCLDTLYIVCLLIFYTAGNYMVVRESYLSDYIYNGLYFYEIPFAFLFYSFTFLCPMAYVYFGLTRKDRTLLWIGLLGFAFSIYTIRRYHSVMPIETALLFGGLLISTLSYFAMRRLKGKTSGLTFEPDRFETSDEQKNLEALSLIENYGLKPSSQNTDNRVNMGDGEFGGAGSGGKF